MMPVTGYKDKFNSERLEDCHGNKVELYLLRSNVKIDNVAKEIYSPKFIAAKNWTVMAYYSVVSQWTFDFILDDYFQKIVGVEVDPHCDRDTILDILEYLTKKHCKEFSCIKKSYFDCAIGNMRSNSYYFAQIGIDWKERIYDGLGNVLEDL